MTTMFAATTRRTQDSSKRRICFPITSRAYYGRSQLLLKKLQEHPGVELELMLGGSILLDKYSRHIAEDIFQQPRSAVPKPLAIDHHRAISRRARRQRQTLAQNDDVVTARFGGLRGSGAGGR